MRYIRVVISPASPITATEEAFVAAPEVQRGEIHKLGLLEDGSGVVVRELIGPTGAIHEALEEADLHSYELTETGNTVTLYAHFETSPGLAELLELFDQHELFLDFPIEFTEDGDIRMVVIGNADAFRRIGGHMPDGYGIEIEEMGEYGPETQRLFDTLTERQQEILRTAMEIGYYDSPRKATQRDIAAKLDVSDGTVGEHLRKIEQTVLTSITPDTGTGGRSA